MRGLRAPAKQPVSGEDEEESSVGDGLGACGGGVAVYDAVLCERFGVDPVEACAGGSEESAGAGQEGAGLLVLARGSLV